METFRAENQGFSTVRLGRIRPVMQRIVDEGKLAGILTMITRYGKLVHHECVGFRNLATKAPIQEDSLFRIYSMSKLITSVAVMMLYEENAFRLVDPVSAFLPEFMDIQVAEKDPEGQWQLVPVARPITIHDLLTHTSGLSYGEEPDHYADQLLREKLTSVGDLRGAGALRNLVRAIAAAPLHHQPGLMFHYGFSTDVLGCLVEVIAGRPFGEFLQQRIFEPLHMLDTGFYVPPEKLERFACMYGPLNENGQPVPGKLVDIDPILSSRYLDSGVLQSGGGGLVSTAPDYLRFCQMLLNNGELDGERLLGRKTVELMRLNHLPEGVYQDPEVRARGFGLGGYVLLHPERNSANGSVGNIGWGGAANTFFWIDYAEQMVAIIMTQYQPFSPFPLEDMFMNLVYQALV